jgi:uncharacterized cupin superfamily protein
MSTATLQNAYKVDFQSVKKGSHGEFQLASGNSIALRRWKETPQDKPGTGPLHTSPHETVGFMLSGKAELLLDGNKKLELKAGDSWTVPANVAHQYKIIEDIDCIEATCPGTHKLSA